MSQKPKKKISFQTDARLYAQLSKLAKENGQSLSALLAKAVEHYLRFVAPSQRSVRPEVMSHFRRSTAKNRTLHQFLTK
jgi:hypothetical protein